MSYYLDYFCRRVAEINNTEKKYSRSSMIRQSEESSMTNRGCISFQHLESYSSPKHTSKRLLGRASANQPSFEIQNMSSISKPMSKPIPEDSTSQKILSRLDQMIRKYEKPQSIGPTSPIMHGSEESKPQRSQLDHSYSKSPARSFL